MSREPAVWEQLRALSGLGTDIGDVASGQMALRTIIIYAATLIIVRTGSGRFLAKASAFDRILAVTVENGVQTIRIEF